METVAIVIPTLNEEHSIGKIIDDVPVVDLLKNGLETAVYVIDGQSTDNTREIAVEKGAQLILEEKRGNGSAIQTAFKSITSEYAIMVDGDDTYPIEMATEMTRLLQTHDVVIGSRLKRTLEPGAMTKLNVVGNVLLSLLAWALFGAHISDVCTGFWAYRSDAIRRLELTARGFELEADMFAECARNGLRIAEIPIIYRARQESPAKLSSYRDGLRIGAFLFRKWHLYRAGYLRRAPAAEEEVAARVVRPVVSPVAPRAEEGPIVVPVPVLVEAREAFARDDDQYATKTLFDAAVTSLAAVAHVHLAPGMTHLEKSRAVESALHDDDTREALRRVTMAYELANFAGRTLTESQRESALSAFASLRGHFSGERERT